MEFLILPIEKFHPENRTQHHVLVLTPMLDLFIIMTPIMRISYVIFQLRPI